MAYERISTDSDFFDFDELFDTISDFPSEFWYSLIFIVIMFVFVMWILHMFSKW